MTLVDLLSVRVDGKQLLTGNFIADLRREDSEIKEPYIFHRIRIGNWVPSPASYQVGHGAFPSIVSTRNGTASTTRFFSYTDNNLALRDAAEYLH